ncbi:MAG: HAMP domain-containing histidine kinase, partial [Clostridia bacterium]|nr:HAMP domain-containing histidine kinase [Clostridia bacterium]
AEGKYFIVKSGTKADGRVYYGVYDRTEDRSILIALSIIGGIIYCAAMIILIVICYILSSKTTAPVKDAMLRQRDLIANASHELKTPLAVISTNLSVVKSEPESTVRDNEKWITAIEGQVGRMDGLIKNMLELSKLEQSELPKTDLDFSSIVEGACLELEPVCFEKGITLVTNVEKNITVYGERASLERLVIILLDNAMKYSGEKGKVGCKLTVDNKIRLSVLNTGETITEEDAKHVFDRFYRSDGARKNPDNNSFGLGLSIAQATVQAHGGTISCHGVENKGSVFEVVLPLAKKKHKADNAE